MPEITNEAERYFHDKIVLPMVLTVLENDKLTVMQQPFKLKRPYITKIEHAIAIARDDMKAVNTYLLRNNMRVILTERTDTESEYLFMHANHERRKRIPHEELRNMTEARLEEYLRK